MISLPQKQQQSSSIFTGVFKMCFILYMMQGIVISVGGTMPYVYSQLPTYETLTIFSIIELPSSLKFLISPFLEKYTNLQYGKRKTWIVVSQLLCAVFLFLSSFFTKFSQVSTITVALLVSSISISIQDISLDSLSIKQLKCPQKTSIIQSIAQTFGTVFGSLFLLKLTSKEFAQKIGILGSITHPQVIIRVIACLLVVSAFLMHFWFKETILESQRRSKDKSLWEIASYIKHFFDIKSRYCRTAIFFFVFYQGFIFFESGYDLELVNSGVSRDTSNSIRNMISLPILLLIIYMATWTSKLGIKTSLIFSMVFLALTYFLVLLFFPTNVYAIGGSQLIMFTIATWVKMIVSMMINSFPVHGLSGMFITIMVSIINFASLKTATTYLIGIYGWRSCATFGLIFQGVVIWNVGRIMEWIEEGNIDIGESVAEQEEEEEPINQQIIITGQPINDNLSQE